MRPAVTAVTAPTALLSLLITACAPGGNEDPDAGFVDLPAAEFPGTAVLDDGAAGVVANAPDDLLGANASHVYFAGTDTSGGGGGASIFRVGHAGGTVTRLYTSAPVAFGSRGGGFAMNGNFLAFGSGATVSRGPLDGGARTTLQGSLTTPREYFFVGDTLYFDSMIRSRPGLHRSTDGVTTEHVTSFAGPYAADDTYAYMINGIDQTRVARFKLDGSSTQTEQLAGIAGEEMVSITRLGEWLYLAGPSLQRVKTTDGSVEVIVPKERGPVRGFAIDGDRVWFMPVTDSNGQTTLKTMATHTAAPVDVATGTFSGTFFAAGGYAFVLRIGSPYTIERFPVPPPL